MTTAGEIHRLTTRWAADGYNVVTDENGDGDGKFHVATTTSAAVAAHLVELHNRTFGDGQDAPGKVDADSLAKDWGQGRKPLVGVEDIEPREGETVTLDPGTVLNGEFDAAVWAREFMKRFQGTQADEGTMLSWFANAIMTGYDAGHPVHGSRPHTVEPKPGPFVGFLKGVEEAAIRAHQRLMDLEENERLDREIDRTRRDLRDAEVAEDAPGTPIPGWPEDRMLEAAQGLLASGYSVHDSDGWALARNRWMRAYQDLLDRYRDPDALFLRAAKENAQVNRRHSYLPDDLRLSRLYGPGTAVVSDGAVREGVERLVYELVSRRVTEYLAAHQPPLLRVPPESLPTDALIHVLEARGFTVTASQG